uniref:Uncharacterized protein n=1 Tax=Arundo donax TaxID=35708 RepID=A0A0A9ELV9_ARUDO
MNESRYIFLFDMALWTKPPRMLLKADRHLSPNVRTKMFAFGVCSRFAWVQVVSFVFL